MEANCHPFFGLAEEREPDAIAFRKSRLILANSFLVGTFLSVSRFSFASNGELLQLKAHLDGRLCYGLPEAFERIKQFMNELMVCAIHAFKPSFAAIGASVSQRIVLLNRYKETGHTTGTFKLKARDVFGLDNDSLFGGHITSEVQQ